MPSQESEQSVEENIDAILERNLPELFTELGAHVAELRTQFSQEVFASEPQNKPEDAKISEEAKTPERPKPVETVYMQTFGVIAALKVLSDFAQALSDYKAAKEKGQSSE